ncbi:Gaa1-like GPI transamidase component family protein [Cryptosporidium meleagridis]|uniref:Gaa1-like GPI transamidase component family protein n=1 Tax=Cryptosporidium meleagridis TaxID=93969 RepID=A0A2P4Z2R5_9CRYT|nr:Gaa1-like GPI transamidase component family protein [Cryptosporidium meleagridis]
MGFNIVGIIRLTLFFIGVLLLLSLPGFDKITQVKESGFSEGVNKPTIDRSIVLEYKKVTQEILTSQKSGNAELVAQTLINSIARDTHCIECDDSGDIDIIKNKSLSSYRYRDSYLLSSGYIAAVVPSKRGDSSEAIIISVSFPWKYRDGKDELGSAAGLIIPLSKHFEKVYWTSKDIILLFTDSNISNSMGINSFLKDLATDRRLLKYNGRIRTAICIEILSLTPTRVFIDTVESMDGLQTNQDFPNSVIREIESSFTYPPISIITRNFWDSIARQAFNRGSYKPHSRFLQNNINSFTLSLVDEFSMANNKIWDHFKDSNDVNEFISIFPIQKFEIYKFLEGIVKIQSNLHDELHQSSKKYYFTSYFSTLNFGIYLVPIILMLISFAIGILTHISNESSILLIGIILIACLISITAPIILLVMHLFDKMGYFLFDCSNLSESKYINLWPLFIVLTFVVFFVTFFVTSSINMFITLFNIQKNSSVYKDIINSIKIMNNIFLIIFSIILSTKNFSILVFIIPIILFIIFITDSSTFRKFMMWTILLVILLNFCLYNKKRNDYACILSKIAMRTRYFLIGIANILHSKHFIYSPGFDISKARNSASIWNSVLGNEIFCHKQYFSEAINNFCRRLSLDSFDQVSKQYKMIKSIPILQWISWVEIKIEKNMCNYNGRNFYEIFTENLFHLFRDDRCLKSTILKHLLIGLLSPLILALSLTFL